MTKTEQQQEALERARNGSSVANEVAIIQGFRDKGIPEADILPRVNVFTFNAWKAEGRSVKKGEHGVRVETFIPVINPGCPNCTDRACGQHGLRPKTAVVFHVSQTEPTADAEARWATRTRAANGEKRYTRRRDDSWKNDPGEQAADRWNETHGDRWIES